MTLFLAAIAALAIYIAGYRHGRRDAEPPEVVFRDCANPGFGEDDGHVWVRVTSLDRPVSLRMTVEQFDNALICARNNAGDDPWANRSE